MSGQNDRDLIARQKAMDLVECVDEVNRSWPKEDLYGLTSPVHPAAVSIPSDVAEGQGSVSPEAFVHHLSIADGSLREVEAHILITHPLKDVDQSAVQRTHAAGIGDRTDLPGTPAELAVEPIATFTASGLPRTQMEVLCS